MRHVRPPIVRRKSLQVGSKGRLERKFKKTITKVPGDFVASPPWTLTEKDLRGIENSMIDKLYFVLYLLLFVLVNDCCGWDRSAPGNICFCRG
jgi:hypothetical protein